MNDLGKVAYEGYGAAVKWTTVSGSLMPKWEDLRPHLRDAWDAATQAVARELISEAPEPVARELISEAQSVLSTVDSPT